MPKKSKAQKLRAVQRPVVQPKAVAGVADDPNAPKMLWGRHLSLRFLLHAIPAPDGPTTVHLLVIDELRDGALKVFRQEFEPEAVSALVDGAPFKFLKADKLQAAKVIEFGRRISRALERDMPEGFDAFRESFGELPAAPPAPGTYLCPISDEPLSPPVVERIKKNALGGIDGYYVSDRYQGKMLGAKHPRYALPMHVRYKTALLESEELTFTPSGWDNLERAIQSENFEDVVGLAMTQDVARGTAFSCEKFLADGTVVNPWITDADVKTALETIRKAFEEETEIPTDGATATVSFVLDLLDEATALCKQIFVDNAEKPMETQTLLDAIDVCLAALNKYGSATNPRGYIDFLAANVR